MQLLYSTLPIQIANNSLQLDSSWRLACEIVGDSAHTMHLIDDPRGDLGQKVVVEGVCNRGHEIFGANCSEDDDVFINALVTHDANCPGWIKCSKCLSDLVVQAGLSDHGNAANFCG